MRTLPRRLHPVRLQLFLSGLLFSIVVLAGAPAPPLTETSESKAQFNLVPRSFQKNPLVEQTVVTELTEEGRKLPPPSSAQPVYYVMESAGHRDEGHGPADRRPPAPDEIATTLQHALAVNGYRPSTPAHPPTLLVVYFWGAHTNLDQGSLDLDINAFPDPGHRHLLSRASLVGGTRFGQELRTVLQKQDEEEFVNQQLLPEIRAMLRNVGPLQLFVRRDLKTQQLWAAATGDCYYAVASAYDYTAATSGQRRLLWRSRMTINSQGVAMRDSLPGLVLNAGKYLGVDMPEPATMTRRVLRDGQVTLGPLEVGEFLDQPVRPPADEKSAAGKKP